MLKHLNGELDKMLALGVVQPSSSAWASPVLLVKKPSGEYRFCFDGRKLNSLTRHDAYPLPMVDQILNKLTGAQYLSSIDLKAAFWQIPLEDESREKTAFVVPGRGLYEFTVLPFGLCNAAQAQQRLMDTVLGPELDPYCFVYLDDIIISSSEFGKHLEILAEVYRRLKEANLTINLDKCEFCRSSLKYLGYVVDQEGLRTDPDKVAAILEYPLPQTVTQLRRFIGMSGWYRRFIKNFSDLSAPLTFLIKGKKKRQRLVWTPLAENCFQQIKEALVRAPVLAAPDFNKIFSIQCDASDAGLGSVLTQLDGEGNEVVVAFASRTLTALEKKYSVTEKECLAVLFAVEKFRPYIEGTKFKVITDHYSLLWLHSLKDPTGRLARWSMKLQQYDMVLEHRKGVLNTVPDALSRAPRAEINMLTLDENECIIDEWYQRMKGKVNSSPEQFPNWIVKEGLLYKHNSLRIGPNTNFPTWKLVVPTAFRDQVLLECHESPTAAHLGVYKTRMRVSDLYYWPKLRGDVKRFVEKCSICASQKSSNLARPGHMGRQKQVSFPWQLISVDLLGPLPRSKSGHKYLLVVSDWFTKFSLLHLLREANAKNIVKFIEEQVILVYGSPQVIMCDNGTQFAGTLFKKMAETYGCEIWFNAKYHAQVNPVERVNRVVGTAI